MSGRPDPADPARRIVALLELNRLDRARAELAAELARDPESGLWWHLLALTELQAGNCPEALDAVRQAIGAGCDTADVLASQARILAVMDRDAEAVEVAGRVLALEPDHVEAHIVIARLLAIGKREYERALYHARRARALAPDSPEAHAVLGIVMLSKGSWRLAGRARDPLRTATRLDPSNVDALHGLALADLRRRRPARAIRGFASVLQLAPQSTVAAYNLPLAVWVYLMRLRWTVLGLLLLAMSGAIVAGRADGVWAGAVAHVAASAIVAGAAWLLLARRTVRTFPDGMRTAAVTLLRHDRLARPVVLGKLWVVFCCLVLTSVPWWHPGLLGFCAVAGYFGYLACLMVARFRLGKLNRATEAERQAAWSTVALT
ncbi:tetratricopeptide repeat protein [Amycolatopsis anabasis]|uniref:tetratricopeptide repeat protein n=1 Tax=Amycolatopsis anabasis TaxID=1840409 RepID=UPI00131D719B|nr:tetratricopeptide repeat protein [Amycolatopsis anabasis]